MKFEEEATTRTGPVSHLLTTAPLTMSLVCTSVILLAFNFMKGRKRQSSEPELVKGVPFFGSGFEFQRDAVQFFLSCAKRYGDLFTIRLPMNYLHVLMDPHSYDAFARNKALDFDPIQRMVNKNVFNFRLKDARKIIREASKIARASDLTVSMVCYSRYVTESLSVISKKCFLNLQEDHDQSAAISSKDRKNYSTEIHLKQLLAATQFRAIFNAIFGAESDDSEFNYSSTQKRFDIFHKYFNYLWLGFPVQLFPKAHQALKELINSHPTADELLKRETLSMYIRTALSRMIDNNQTHADILGHNLVYLHVNYNTVKANYWLLVFLMKHPESKEALLKEIDEFLSKRSHGETNSDGEKQVDVNLVDIDQLVVLDSIVKESFRMSSGVLMVREVTENTDFSLESGKTFKLRKNDKIAIYPPAIHHNPEIYDQPYEFQYDRFIERDFYKNGKVIQKPLIPFGALCPGQKVSIYQIKAFTLAFLAYYDFDLCPGEEIPQFNKSCYGHEILSPIQDTKIKVDQREDAIVVNLLSE